MFACKSLANVILLARGTVFLSVPNINELVALAVPSGDQSALNYRIWVRFGQMIKTEFKKNSHVEYFIFCFIGLLMTYDSFNFIN